MPFFDEDQLSGGITEPVQPTLETTGGASFGQAFKTSLLRTPVIRAPADYITDQMFRPSGPKDPNFDPLAPGHIDGYEMYSDSLADAKNIDDLNYLKSKINKENRDKDIMYNSAHGTFANLAAGLFDPINMIPVIGQGGKVYELGKLGRIASASGRLALFGGGATAFNEALTQATSETRTAKESALTIGSATLFSGVLGAAFGTFAANKTTQQLAESFSKAEGEGELFATAIAASHGSVGAAATFDTNLAQETLKNAFGAEKILSFQDPVFRTAVSPSVTTRQITQELAEQPLMRAKNADGIASPIAAETLMRNWHGGLAVGNEELENAFVKYRTGSDRQLLDTTKITVGDAFSKPSKLTLNEFSDEVGKAMRRGDTHEIPEVAQAAALMRRNVFDPLKNEAIDLGLLPKGVKPTTADSYLTRIYDTPKIIAERPAFEAKLVEWLKVNYSKIGDFLAEKEIKLQTKLNEAGAAGETKSGKIAAQIEKNRNEIPKLNDNDIQDIASQITDTILGNARGRTAYGGVPLVRGPLKDRVLTITDAAIEPWLESDARKISRIYTRTMAADVELTRKFGRADMEDQLSKIRDNYNQLRNGVEDPDKLTKLNKQMKADLRDTEAMRDRLRGTFALPDNPDGIGMRGARVIKNLNYLRLLGGMTLSSISDMGRTTMVHGISRTVMDGIVPMIKNFKGYRLASSEVKLAGNALDMIMDDRVMSLADITHDFGRNSKFERGIEALSDKFGMVSLMAPWNATLKQFASVVTQTRMLQTMENLVKANPKEIERLAFLGIDKNMAARIAKQFKEFGNKEDGIYWAHTAVWTDKEAISAYRSAMSKEVNITIVTPGQDKPLFMSRPIIGMIGQFKSFAFAANQRVLMAGLQQRDASVLSGTLLSVFLGAMAYGLKTPNDKLSSDPRQWIVEGIDKSGITGNLFDVNNILEKSTEGKIGISALTGKQVSRYASRSVTSALLGPGPGLIDDAARTAGKAATLRFDQTDVHKLRQMLPFQNVFYIKSLFDKMEEGVNKVFGVPKKSEK